MADFGGSYVYIDANGRTRQVLPKATSLLNLGLIEAQVANLSNAAQQAVFSGSIAYPGGTPFIGSYQSVADTARYLFQTAAGTILRLTVPAPTLAQFLGDGVTVDPSNPTVIALVAACIGNLTDGHGNVAVTFLGGRYDRSQGSDLNTP